MNNKNYHKINLSNLGAYWGPACQKEQKGITLIALIITIIVILILVAVSVRTISKSGLFDHAKDATNKWADAQEKEASIGDGPIEINGQVYDSIDDYVKITNMGIVEPENIEDWEYIIEDDDTVTLTSYKGSDIEVIVPNQINGLPVKRISPQTNRNSIWNTSICTGNSYNDPIGGYIEHQNTITSVIISDGIEEIGSNAFCASHALKKVYMPQSIKVIGWEAFARCISLEKITIPKNVHTIGHVAFGGCIKLKEIVIPKSVINLSNCIFAENDESFIANIEYKEEEIPTTWDEGWDNARYYNHTEKVAVNYGVSQ